MFGYRPCGPVTAETAGPSQHSATVQTEKTRPGVGSAGLVQVVSRIMMIAGTARSSSAAGRRSGPITPPLPTVDSEPNQLRAPQGAGPDSA